MLRTNFPRAVRVLRRRRHWRQKDLALRAGVSRQGITRIELGQMKGMPISTFVRVAEALGGSVDLTMRWEGEQLDRLADAAHAWLTEQVSSSLLQAAWSARTEISFNHYGDRGRVDVLGWHPSTRALVVVEVKSAIGDLQETLGRARREGTPGPHARRRGRVGLTGGCGQGPRHRRLAAGATNGERPRSLVRRVPRSRAHGAGVDTSPAPACSSRAAVVRESAGSPRGGPYAISTRSNLQHRRLTPTG